MASGFKDYITTHNLQTWGSLSEFTGTRLAIDAEDYLHTLLTNPQTREPLLPALGGLPFALQKHVDESLQGFKDAGIDVVWVFNGLQSESQSGEAVDEWRKASEGLSHAWRVYDEGKGDEAVVAFGKSCTYKTAHITRSLLSHLHDKSQTILVAPYTAAAQCVYLESTSHVDAIAGSASALIFGAERVITTFDFSSQRIAWAELRTLSGKFMLNKPAFEDLMLLSGCIDILLPCLPELEPQDGITRIQSARAMLTRFRDDGHAAALSVAQNSQMARPPTADPSPTPAMQYLDSFRRAKYAIRHAVHLTHEGHVTPFAAEKLPNDAHDFVGQRLPEEVYYYLSRGLIGPRVLNWRTSMSVTETPPLDGLGVGMYRDVVRGKGMNGLRAQALALLTKSLHRYYQKTDVDLVCWFNEAEKRPLGIPDLSEPSANADTWHVKETSLPKASSAGSASTQLSPLNTPILYAISSLAEETAAKATKTPRTDFSTLSSPTELITNTTWRFLHDRGYINPDHSLSAWGKALKTSLDYAQQHNLLSKTTSPIEIEEALLMAYELLRLEILTTKPLFPTTQLSGAPLRGTDTDKANTLLISRVASLGLFKHAAIGYTGPLSRHLLAYQQLTSLLRSGLRDLLEMHAANIFLSGSADRKTAGSPTVLTEVGSRLPLARDPDLGLSLVVKSYLDELSNEPERRSDIRAWFNHAEDVEGDLGKCWGVWEAINAGVQAADSSVVNNETRKVFATADEWLKGKRAIAAGGGGGGKESAGVNGTS
ncbi:hypothetical protein D0869_08702 [Hortaea werneckii]|uniref:XPG-I domain-containing protein n=2 Tax=Hortaea werneckii TaxID=91943 RepID=A0A3M6WKF0_HORWE|nr:PIN domain-like protein [Hortaea werneckii]KAI7020348.1 PIN domain-like protein [Hortaea werneckii]KAI7203602.1 PIN domain-like protein [Hortaea werneckii]KAI7589539.1 PIN domain-like protein [Hortaea werneckii]RMX78909.1 hypothetical protein D0869_08702 [Hortaea werneckii]